MSEKRQAAAPAKPTAATDPGRGVEDRVREVLGWLERTGTKANRDGMARYAIPSDRAFGVTVGELREQAKQIGRDQALAAALWETGRYEARMLACFVGEPARLTPEQMDGWCREFDSWAICDTACFHLFDRSPHAWSRVERWAQESGEFQKRAAFVLVWSLSAHDEQAADAKFLATFPLIEEAARDGRNFVKKGVDLALRALGKRNPTLNAAALELAERLAASPEPAARWVGKSTLRELRSRSVAERLSSKRAAPPG